MFPRPSKPISDSDKLLAYAAWYYGRYAPPLSKLEAKLRSKAATPELSNEAFGRFSELVSDRGNLESRVASAIAANKSLPKLRAKLIAKGFARDDVAHAIGENPDSDDWSARYRAVSARMATLAGRGKSRAAALSTLRMEFPEFRDRIPEAVDSEYPRDVEILRAFHDAPPENEAERERKRRFDRLVRAGFRYADLEAFFSGSEG